MLYQCLTGRAIASHDVHYALRQPNFLADVRKSERGQRRELCRLQDHGISRGQRRSDFPGEHQERKIPRNNLAYDTARCVAGELLFKDLRPPRVMIEMSSNQRNINVAALTD